MRWQLRRGGLVFGSDGSSSAANYQKYMWLHPFFCIAYSTLFQKSASVDRNASCAKVETTAHTAKALLHYLDDRHPEEASHWLEKLHWNRTDLDDETVPMTLTAVHRALAAFILSLIHI